MAEICSAINQNYHQLADQISARQHPATDLPDEHVNTYRKLDILWSSRYYIKYMAASGTGEGNTFVEVVVSMGNIIEATDSNHER